MPPRKVILATGETYHIFNRSLHEIPLFNDNSEFKLFITGMKYYLQTDPPVKFSIYRREKNKYQLDFSQPLVKIIAYCLMPDHFHLILTQQEEEGIRKYIHRLASSYSHFFNLISKQSGTVFESRFKAVRIKSQEQLIHLSRYIHLNPVTSYLVENPQDYSYSSYKAYLNKEQSDFIDTSIVMEDFKAVKNYEKFVLARKEYQRELKRIEHLTFE